MKYRPHSFCIFRRSEQAVRKALCSLHTSLLVAGSHHWGGIPMPYGSYSSRRSSFGFSDSCARCRVSSIMKGTSFTYRTPHHWCCRYKGREKLSRLLAHPHGLHQLCRCSFMLSTCISYPSSFSTACPVDFWLYHQTQKANASHNGLTMSDNCVINPLFGY